jgi:hypothetical protein
LRSYQSIKYQRLSLWQCLKWVNWSSNIDTKWAQRQRASITLSINWFFSFTKDYKWKLENFSINQYLGEYLLKERYEWIQTKFSNYNYLIAFSDLTQIN